MAFVLVLTALAGCASKPPAPAPAAQAAPPTVAGADVQCHQEHLTGSLIPKRVCTTAAQREAMRHGAQDVTDALNRIVIPPDCSAGSCK